MLETAPRFPRPSAPELSALTEAARPMLSRLDGVLEEQVGSFEPEVKELAQYALRASGKRLRPLLVFFSGQPDNGDEVRDLLVRAGAVVELVHVATLVHDDILDDATLRHRQETVAARYGSQTAVLLGDALFAQALQLAASFPLIEVCREVSQATRQVCSGEIMQTLSVGQKVTRSRYFRVIELKTAELFRVSCYLGALLSGHDQATQLRAADFGRELGVAYQIYDDLADFLADEAKAGKTLGTDLASGKVTLPLLLLEERNPEMAEVLEDRARFQHDEAAIRDLISEMDEVDAFDASRTILEKHLTLAEAALDDLPEHDGTEALRGLAAYLRNAVSKLG